MAPCRIPVDPGGELETKRREDGEPKDLFVWSSWERRKSNQRKQDSKKARQQESKKARKQENKKARKQDMKENGKQ